MPISRHAAAAVVRLPRASQAAASAISKPKTGTIAANAPALTPRAKRLGSSGLASSLSARSRKSRTIFRGKIDFVSGQGSWRECKLVVLLKPRVQA